MTDVILTLHYPKSGTTQVQEFPSIQIAMTVAHDHLAAFPDGYAQISDKQSNDVLMPCSELRATMESARRRAELPDEMPAAGGATGAGLFSRWFGKPA